MKVINNGGKAKKPFYKRWWFWTILLLLVIGAFTGENDDVQKKVNETLNDNQSTKIEKDERTEEIEELKESPKVSQKSEGGKETMKGKDIGELEDLVYSESVNKDVTGKWRCILITDDIDIKDYAWSAFEKYKKTDEDIIGVINFTKKTSTSIKDLGGFLDVSTYEYIKGEEHDAKEMFGGMLLEEYFIYNDGKQEKIQ